MVVYASIDQVYAEPVLKAFESETGIRVLPVFDVEAAKTTGLVNRLIAEKNMPRADVFWNGEFMQTLALARRGVLAPYFSPARAGLPPRFLDSEGHWAGAGGRVRVLLGHRHAPRNTLAALLDPALPGKAAGIAYPLFGTTATHAAALYAAWGPERARGFFEQLRARGVRVVDGNSTVRDLVAAGHLRLGLTDSDDACGALKRGAQVQIAIPDETLVVAGTVALVRGGPHPGEGRRLVDYLLSGRVERKLIDSGFFQVSLRTGRVESGCLAGMELKGLDVSPGEVEREFPRSRAELEKLFAR